MDLFYHTTQTQYLKPDTQAWNTRIYVADKFYMLDKLLYKPILYNDTSMNKIITFAIVCGAQKNEFEEVVNVPFSTHWK